MDKKLWKCTAPMGCCCTGKCRYTEEEWEKLQKSKSEIAKTMEELGEKYLNTNHPQREVEG